MPVRAGIGAQLVVATESTYGTYVAGTTGLPFISEDLRLIKEYIRTVGLRANRLVQSEALHVATTRAGDGNVNIDVLTKSMGKLFNQLHGLTVTPTQIAATTAYRQTHNIGTSDPFGKSLSIQVGRPDVGATVRPFSYLGCKVTGVTFSMERGGVLTSKWTFDIRDEDTGQTLATATYASGAIPFNFQGGSIELDDVVLTDCVRSAQITLEIPQNTDRYCISSSPLKKEPISNDQIAITMELEVEFASLTRHTDFTASTRRKVELNCSTGDAGGGNAFQCNFTAAKAIPVGQGTVVDGPDVLTSSWTYEVVDDGTAVPLIIEYVTTDTSL